MKNLFWLLPLVLLILGCTSDTAQQSMQTENKPFDWQGHRGARGLLPENSIPAFLKALEYPQIRTLEMDVVISADGYPIVSHEPWMSAELCRTPDSLDIKKSEEKSFNLYDMTVQEIRAFDCGSKGNDRFPEQKPLRVFKPLLIEIIDIGEAYTKDTGRPAPYYNIELKSRPEWDTVFTPGPRKFVDLVLREIRKRPPVKDRIILQSFDMRILREIHRRDSSLTLSCLGENIDGMDTNIEALGFTPDIYSPYYKMVTANVIREAHERGMKIIPWTVNTTEEMIQLIEMGVDGIITDYPDRIPAEELQ